MRRLGIAIVLLTVAGVVAPIGARQAHPVTYKVTFPEAEHHWLQVEVTWTGLASAPLQARMSRSSPGRYAVHEFAKNVFFLEAFNGKGQQLPYTRPNVDEWDVAGHDGTVKIVYRLFGDYADGTYVGIDTTHAHMNMPATFLWAMGHENDAMRITFSPPSGSNWKVGTQLFPTSDPWTFTAPNLQYFMDSPTELSDFVMSTFSVPNSDGSPAEFRLVVHGDGSQADVDELAKLVSRLVREQMAVYGEFPKYEPGHYTFLLDYSPWGDGDGMEHRNSTSISSPGLTIRTPQSRQQRAMGTISHEFFHNWNVERIRPVGLEPFDFTRENITCCLWLAEGFTQYYGPLLLVRAGLAQNPPVNVGNAIITGAGRSVRSAVQMSEYAAFSDAATSVDATDRNRTFISYYSYGAAIALALDLSLREMSNGKQSLDDYMRLLWQRFGKPGGPAPGLVGRPYSLKDIREALADLTNNKTFANDFFDKYIEGRELPDYATLLRGIGYVLRPARPDAAWIGNAQITEVPDGLRVGIIANNRDEQRIPVAFDTPLYKAGVDEDDVITKIDDQAPTLAAWRAIAQRKPGDTVTLVVRRRDGKLVTTTAKLVADPGVQVTAIELAGGTLTDAQRTLREGWLASKVR
ncbi:MAG TPA: PDZ domain-containing protein [Vicinamibacterales bacterium]|nr:PDZ domain-containing protein [Vicinamibacterales bacterium]